MRTDCRHWFRRTSASGEVAESCDLGAAPGAPRSCPAGCPLFEKRSLSTTGFDYGSLGAVRHGGSATAGAGGAEPSEDESAVLAALEAIVEDVSDDVVAAEAERRRAEEKARQRRRRKPPRKKR